jgi:hypothetical protein
MVGYSDYGLGIADIESSRIDPQTLEYPGVTAPYVAGPARIEKSPLDLLG